MVLVTDGKQRYHATAVPYPTAFCSSLQIVRATLIVSPSTSTEPPQEPVFLGSSKLLTVPSSSRLHVLSFAATLHRGSRPAESSVGWEAAKGLPGLCASAHGSHYTCSLDAAAGPVLQELSPLLDWESYQLLEADCRVMYGLCSNRDVAAGNAEPVGSLHKLLPQTAGSQEALYMVLAAVMGEQVSTARALAVTAAAVQPSAGKTGAAAAAGSAAAACESAHSLLCLAELLHWSGNMLFRIQQCSAERMRTWTVNSTQHVCYVLQRRRPPHLNTSAQHSNCHLLSTDQSVPALKHPSLPLWLVADWTEGCLLDAN